MTLDLETIKARAWLDRWSRRDWDKIPYGEIPPSTLVDFYLRELCDQIEGS